MEGASGRRRSSATIWKRLTAGALSATDSRLGSRSAMNTQAPLVRRASLDVAPSRPLDMVKPAAGLDEKLIREIGAAAKLEAGSGGQ